ncbi:hypothetical protein HDV05_002324 [Chytridiales sp. JEL 0842]|nr:hypothetical protein HDV05_002324 [Chytridiales sp. JEL 0842]
MFGGNPGDPTNQNLRLDDFWELHLIRPKTVDVLRRAKFLIRKQRFREICHSGDSKQALEYLQTQVSSCVDHKDEGESKEFRELTGWLFKWKEGGLFDTSVGSRFLASVPPVVSGGGAAVGSGGVAGGLATAERTSNPSQDPYYTRTELYESLLEYFPEGMREPKENMVDLIDHFQP